MPKLLVVSPVDLGPELGRTVLWRPAVERFLAPDGESAMELARRVGPSVIVVDGFDPPGATELVRRLRADSHTRPTAIAVLSRSASLADEAAYRRAGATVVFAGVVHPELWDARLEELLNVPRRLEARIPVRLATWSRATPEAAPIEGLTLNISIHGILLQTPARLGVGTKIDLSFTLPGRHEEVQVLGQITRETAAGPDRWQSGVKFLILRGDARERIAAFIEASVLIPGEPAIPAGDAELPERAQWETELRVSEARKAAILETALDAVITMDPEGRIIEFNRAAEEMFGYERADIMGRTVADTIVPEPLRESHHRGLARYLVTGEGTVIGRRVEMIGRRADGSQFPVELSITTVQLDRRRLFTAYLRDITARKQAEDALRKSEERFRALVENSSDGVGLADRQGRVQYSSPSSERVLGWTPEQRHGRPVFEIAHPDDVERAREFFAQCLGTRGTPVTVELRGLHQDGGWRLLEIVAANHLDDPAVGAVVMNYRDITLRRRAEDSVREAARQFRAVFDGALDAMVIADDEGRYVEVNAAACGLYGLGRSALLGHWIGDFAAPGIDVASTWAAFRREGRAKGELRIVRPDGRVRELEFAASADFLPGSHLAVFRDVTQRRQLEEQLRQAQKIEAVGRLAGGVAHDFNNLLNVITGYGQMLFRRLAEGPEREKTRAILQAADRAAGLTRQLLAFSRKQVLEPKVLDLNAVVSGMDEMLRRLIGEDIELEADLAADLGRTRADPGQLEQVLMNLVVNARDAMPRGGRVTLETANAEMDDAYVRDHLGARPGRYVTLAVRDTGLGMDAETQKHIFEPFFTTKEKGKGTGLGLATVYGIVKQSEGYIWVESAPGAGTTVRVYLPRVEGEPVAEGPKRPAVPEEAPARGTETVLLVEDEEMVRRMTREVLEGAGYQVLEAASGFDALRVSSGHRGRLDLLLTDVVMPGMSGRELAERLAPVRPGMRVLYMSGHTDDAIFHHGVTQAATGFLQKPFTPETLERRVRELLGHADTVPAPQPDSR
jgi:two-component system, cell cycle sensor histidine kinase and response regulator CckA